MSDPTQSPWIGSSPTPSPYHAATAEDSPPPTYPQVALGPRKNGLGTTSFVISLVALGFALIPYAIDLVPFLCSVGIFLGFIALLLPGRRKRKAAIALLVYTAAIIVSSILSSLYGQLTNPSDSSGSYDNTDTSGTTDASDAATQSYTSQYGSFTPITKTGVGNGFIDLPIDDTSGLVDQGIAQASTTGTGKFEIQTVDDSNHGVDPPIVSETGAYSGNVAYGLGPSGIGASSRLEVTASGPWTISLEPVLDAQAIVLPEDGRGDDVLLYEDDDDSWHVTSAGASQFDLIQRLEGSVASSQTETTLVNHRGPYAGSIFVTGGYSVIIINAQGNWSIQH